MTDQRDVKVFVSWSGNLSKAVALALREWLPLLFDRVAPWASDTDIAAGQRGLAQIEAELADTRFGLVIVTAENQDAPWLNFEAGALSKTVAGVAEHRVVPLLVDLSSASDLTGPLAQFQAKMAQRAGIRDVIQSLAAVAGISDITADNRFNAYWPQLEAHIKAARETARIGPAREPEPRAKGEVLDEILLHVRSLRSDLEGPLRSGPTLTTTQRAEREFQQFATELADVYKMEVFMIEEGEGFGKRKVTLAPKDGNYSEEEEEAVKRAFHEHPSNLGNGVYITVIPF